MTVVITSGTYFWSGTSTITKLLTLAGASATSVNINSNLVKGDMISATAGTNGHINIYWLNILQVADDNRGRGFALVVDRTEPTNYTVLVHDYCNFEIRL